MGILYYIKKFLTFILCTILFFLVLVFGIILSCKSLITTDNLSDYVKSVDILNVDLGIIFNLEKKGVILTEQITDLAIESNIPIEIIDDILKSEEINNILGDFFKSTIDYVLKGENKPEISEKTTLKMIDLAKYSLEEHMNIMLEEDELEKYVRDYSKKLVNIVPERDLIIDNYSVDKINRIVYFDMVNLYILILILCLIICILNKSIYKLFKYIGIIMISTGVILVIVGCLNDFIGSILSYKFSNLENFILPLITIFLTVMFKNGVLLSFTGVFIYLTYVIANRIKLNSIINKSLKKKSKQ